MKEIRKTSTGTRMEVTRDMKRPVKRMINMKRILYPESYQERR